MKKTLQELLIKTDVTIGRFQIHSLIRGFGLVVALILGLITITTVILLAVVGAAFVVG